MSYRENNKLTVVIPTSDDEDEFFNNKGCKQIFKCFKPHKPHKPHKQDKSNKPEILKNLYRKRSITDKDFFLY